MKLFISLILCALFSFNLYSASIDSVVKKARAMKSMGVVKVHPRGEDGGLTPIMAYKALKPGMVLQLLPLKSYKTTITIPNDKIVITTDGARVTYPVKIQGNDCVIKNANLNELIVEKDALILDSVTRFLIVGTENNSKKNNVSIYNTALKSLSKNIYRGETWRHSTKTSNNSTVKLKNCTMKGIFKCPTTLKLTISESILFSESFNFAFTEQLKKKGRVTLKNNLLYGMNGYGKMLSSSTEKLNGVLSMKPKDLKKIWSVIFLGKHIHDMPKFENDSFILTEDSPGKGKGIIPRLHPMYDALKKQKESSDNSLSEKERRQTELNKQKKAREKRRKEAKKK